MANPWVLQQLSGPAGIALGVLAVLGAPVWLVLVGLTFARWRVPAVFWWLFPVVAVAIGALSGAIATTPAVQALQGVDVHELVPLASAALARHHASHALGFFWAALWLAVSCVTLAFVTASRIEHPYTEWVAAILPLSSGSVVCAAAGMLAIVTGAAFVPTLTMLLLTAASIVSIALTSLRTSLSRSERRRVGATRALTLSLGLGGVLACGIGWNHASQAGLYATDPAELTAALRPVIPVTTAFALAIAASGLPALSTARGALGAIRSIASAAALAGLLLVDLGVIWAARLDNRLYEAAQNGAIDRIPDAVWARLPIARDLAEAPLDAEEIDGSCMIGEAADGWMAEPLFAAIPPAEHVARQVRNPDAVHELDRNPGCPEALGPLDGPLAESEIPVVALDGSRAGAAIAGWDWFRERGTLRVLVQADPMRTGGWSRRTVRARAQAVPFIWELPPRIEPVEGHQPGTWDAELAASLPVTLLEGPYPVLLAGGLRSRLPAGDLGAETLRLALTSMPPHRRDLVLVPRKTWTVQDLVGFCLTVQGEVEGVRCVIRPETPARWSLRTRLPLPW